MDKHNRAVAFSGSMFAGKDFVANGAGLKIVGFADPIYKITQVFCGTTDKSVPGIRKFMQAIGQWGWGAQNTAYPMTPERVMMVDRIRRDGDKLIPDYSWVAWRDYGKRQDFWVRILLMRLGVLKPSYYLDGRQERELLSEVAGQLGDLGMLNHAVTNARFHHEMAPLRHHQFEHYHVMCSEETRAERMTAKGYQPASGELTDASEQMAIELNVQALNGGFDPNRVVWNDHRGMPSNREFIPVNIFKNIMYSISH